MPLVIYLPDMWVIAIKKKSFKLLVIIVLLIYISSYYIANSGYYEYHLREKTFLTNEKIKEFEEDVKNRQDVRVKDYLVYEKKDYTNKFTKMMYGISDGGNKIVRKVLRKIFKKVSYYIYE